MTDVQIKLAALWTALMLTYLLGDVLRIFSGDLAKMTDTQAWTQGMWLGISMLMVLPIVMIVLTLLLPPQPLNRWVNILAAGFFFLFNLVGLPSYPSAYDKFLIVVGLAFNVVTVWIAWKWV
jgi:hypothetical protein